MLRLAEVDAGRLAELVTDAWRMGAPDELARGAVEGTVIVASRSGRVVSVGRGEQVRVLDADGHQVGDMRAIDAADPGRWLSASHTRDRCERLFPAAGEQFRDQHGEPVLQLAAGTSPGLTMRR